MSKNNSTIFICSNCDAQFTKWAGRCLECGKWGTIEESKIESKKLKDDDKNYAPTKTTTLNEIKSGNVERTKTNISELDRVLGGGIVPGSLILLGGEPGIGKSTLALQLATSVSPTLYISGEESVEQIKLRANRLEISNIKISKYQNISLANETDVDSICATINANKPSLAIIDSIQTVYSDEIQGEPGNVNQIRACTTKLLTCAKSSNTAIVIIGHVTKDGTVAGPRTLEHLVDTVLYLEGDRFHNHRILRTIKNRFGATDEVGIFEMVERGLRAVENPSASFLEERGENMPGSVITCLIEGTRPLLVEIQALVNKTSFGYPVRKASGFDLNRLHVLAAVLQKRAGLNLAQYDIHINVVGGISADEPAVDLAVCLSIASSYKDKALGKDLVVFGEVGLGGEVRSVSQIEKRIKECNNLGMKRVITHITNLKPNTYNLKMIDVKNIQELIKHT
ncbi:MAG TPA: DNA repair protein RadA [Candidatus Magasanikbacteria bacterium]|nr:MAG: DNA repair protein RadA [Candidatus Magasanikbacteria bacterium RIFOXYC2_FULL_39_8]HAT03699.1 DNA repair protein RadA [Candidatus Magasanikbacteria bacterium]